jgi:saccharopine dehydrogenase-like NADP-dependent oxidoreductase
MGAIAVVVIDELAQDRAQVTLADRYQVVEA